MKAILAAVFLAVLTVPAALRADEYADPPEITEADLALIRQEMKAAGFEPVRPKGNPSTGADYWLLWRGWVRRVLFTPMKANTTAVPWGAEAAAFVEKALNARYTPRWVEDASSALVPEARRLMKAGADDAVFLWLAAEVIGMGEGTWLDARDVAAKARESFRKSKYPRVLGALLYGQKVFHMVPAWRGFDMDEALVKSAEYLAEALEEEDTWQQGDVAFYIEEIENLYNRSFRFQYPDKVKPLFFPEKFPAWARETLAGMWEVHLGWMDRGANWAADEKDAHVREYAAHFRKAAGHLEKAWELNPRQPYAAWRMIVVAAAGASKTTAREWFDRSISARIDYDPAWSSYNEVLRPKWGGSVRRMVAQGLAAVEMGRFDTEAPFYFIHALDNAQDNMASYDGCRELYKQPPVAAAMTGMCEGYFRRSRSKGEREHFAWWRALGGWLSARYGAGEAGLTDTGQRPEPDFVRYRLSRFLADQIRMRGDFALARTGGLKIWDKLDAAHTLMNVEEATRILATLPASKEANPLIKRTATILDMEKRLADGEWVKLTAGPGLSCWQWYTGQWSADANGNLVARGDDERALITHRVKIGPAFDARGTFLCPVKNLEDFEAGLAVTHLTSARGFGSFVVPSLWWTGTKFQASVDRQWWQSGVPFKTVSKFDPLKPVSWAARVEGGKLTWLINGGSVYKDQPLTGEGNLGGFFSPAAPNSRFGFSLRRVPGHVSMTFSPVEIRRLVKPAKR